MRTLVDLERLGNGKWRLRVHRADERGNVIASSPVDGELAQVEAIATQSIHAWVARDEIDAERVKPSPRERSRR